MVPHDLLRSVVTNQFSQLQFQFISHDKTIYKHYNSIDRNKMQQIQIKTYTNSVKIKVNFTQRSNTFNKNTFHF